MTFVASILCKLRNLIINSLRPYAVVNAVASLDAEVMMRVAMYSTWKHEADRDYQRGEEGMDEESVGMPKTMNIGSSQHLFKEYTDYDVDEHGVFRQGQQKIDLGKPLHGVSIRLVLERAAAIVLVQLVQPLELGHQVMNRTIIQFDPLTLAPQHMMPQDACLALVGQQMYPHSIKSDDLADV
ncbi:hypothetical protein E2P81_ATG11758 [Venturia nashicola]|nr:hypothetical protein E2P81_ATG11758 [Venturia nashicola]